MTERKDEIMSGDARTGSDQPRPLVTVIIPNYNHANYLKQRIESVLKQTFRDFEVILLDDCSTDGSAEILRQYAGHPQVREIVINENNSGSPFKQWQRGLGLARGKWIWFAESDDYADPKFLERLLSAAQSRESVGLVYCDSLVAPGSAGEGQEFKNLRNARFNTDRWSFDHTNNGVKEIEDYLLPGGTINNSSAVLFNVKKFTQAFPFDREFSYIGDKYAFIRVLAHSDCVYVSEALNHYRDPFEMKPAQQMINYYYEHFLVFDWVLRNINIDPNKFYSAFYSNTENSLVRYWNMRKLQVYGKVMRMNPSLFLKSLGHNVSRTVRSVFSGGKTAKR